jgi:hypothetical protein
MDAFPEERFPTSDELLKRLQEKSDDIDAVTIMVVNDMPLIGPNGETRLAKNCCCIIKTCTGESIMVHRDEFQTLLNDGILQRMKIPISLLPLEAR